MAGKRIDLTGQKFDRLTVIEYSHTKNKRAYWLCKCDCDNEKIVSRGDLKSGHTKSCGCLQKESRQLPEGISTRNTTIYRHKRNAKVRNLEQALTDEQIIILHKGNCHYCGAPPSNTHFSPGCNGSYIYNGIDRIDNDKGYTLANVVSCCGVCNHAKNNLTYDEFMNWLNRIHSHLNSKQ